MKIMICDVPNLFFRTVAAHNTKYSGSDDDKANLALHSCLNVMNKWYNQRQPDQIVVVFEGSKNWRKAYTSSDKCISKIPYKGNRVKDPALEHLFQVISDFERLARSNTSIICLSNEQLEGDDLLAGCAIRFANEGHDVDIVSGDKDFMQLLKYDNIKLINPDNGVARQCEDPYYFIFEKCIRGDGGDNVRSAFPRVRSTRLQKAYTDPYEMTLLMNEQWEFVNPNTLEKTTYTVKDLFEENKLLMDLESQPDEIKQLIQNTIDEGLSSIGKFSLFEFSKFLGQHELKHIADNINRYVKMLSCKPAIEPKRQGALIF